MGYIPKKVLATARGKGLVQSGDKVLVAFSGGVGSTALLHFLGSMRSAVNERKERNKVAFTLMGIYLDEGCAYGIDLSESESHKAQVLCAMKDVAGTDMESHAVGLEDVFCHPSDDKYQSRVERRNQLQQLLSTVKDTTGQEDLIAYLRHELLKMTAKQLGATKIALGSSATRCAVTTIAWCCKGKGYALPGSIQYRDARGSSDEPVTVLPVRDIAAKELALVCYLKKLTLMAAPILPRPGQISKSINHLTARFVTEIQERIPSSVSAILGTSSKLSPFDFNSVPTQLLGRRIERAEGSASAPPLCPICVCPLSDADLVAEVQAIGRISGICCQSCRLSILNSPDLDEFLPMVVRRRLQALHHAALAALHDDDITDAATVVSASNLSPEQLRKKISGYLLDM